MPFEVDALIGNDEREILEVLTRRVRVLSIDQIARTWPTSKLRSRLGRLQDHGLILLFTAVIHPELPLAAPVVRWGPGEALPDMSSASYQLRSRWSKTGVSTHCVIASRAAGRMFGGHGGRFPRESEETHDVHLAAVYLQLRARDPAAAQSWIHEEEIKAERQERTGKLPDAVLRDSGKIIEFGGAYKKEKLLKFHEYCQAKGLEYEVW